MGPPTSPPTFPVSEHRAGRYVVPGIVGRRMRRRVLVAGAVTGAAAYHAGKKHEQGQQVEELYDAAPPAQYAPATQYAPAPPQSSGPDSGDLDQIQKLAELHS